MAIPGRQPAADGGARVDINAQHFAEKDGGILAAAKRIVRQAAVAEAQIKITVRAKNQFAALVIPERLEHFKDDAFGGHVGLVGVGGGDLEFADNAAIRKTIGRPLCKRLMSSGVFSSV